MVNKYVEESYSLFLKVIKTSLHKYERRRTSNSSDVDHLTLRTFSNKGHFMSCPKSYRLAVVNSSTLPSNGKPLDSQPVWDICRIVKIIISELRALR